jgi:hypothetical protein
MKITVLWDVTPCTLLGTSEEHTASIFSVEAYAHSYSLILKVEAGSFSETSVNFYQTTHSHTPDESNLYIEVEGV